MNNSKGSSESKRPPSQDRDNPNNPYGLGWLIKTVIAIIALGAVSADFLFYKLFSWIFKQKDPWKYYLGLNGLVLMVMGHNWYYKYIF